MFDQRPEDNDGKHISTIIDHVSCEKHAPLLGTPCWYLLSQAGDILRGICNDRALAAGADGPITPYKKAKSGPIYKKDFTKR